MRENGRRNVFMTKTPRKNVPDIGIKATKLHLRPAKTLIRLGGCEESDLGHPPSLIRVFAVRSMSSLGPTVADSEDCSDWADAQADRSLRWVHRLCWLCHAVTKLSYRNHLRKHCIQHCNEFAYE